MENACIDLVDYILDCLSFEPGPHILIQAPLIGLLGFLDGLLKHI
jgi:hypothetical protein